MAVQGAVKTITYTQFRAETIDLPNGGKAIVFTEPIGVAHVFALADEARDVIGADLLGQPPPKRVVVPTAAEQAAATAAHNGRKG